MAREAVAFVVALRLEALARPGMRFSRSLAILRRSATAFSSPSPALSLPASAAAAAFEIWSAALLRTPRLRSCENRSSSRLDFFDFFLAMSLLRVGALQPNQNGRSFATSDNRLAALSRSDRSGSSSGHSIPTSGSSQAISDSVSGS